MPKRFEYEKTDKYIPFTDERKARNLSDLRFVCNAMFEKFGEEGDMWIVDNSYMDVHGVMGINVHTRKDTYDAVVSFVRHELTEFTQRTWICVNILREWTIKSFHHKPLWRDKFHNTIVFERYREFDKVEQQSWWNWFI